MAAGYIGSELRNSRDTAESLHGLRSAPRRCQDHLEQIFTSCGFVPKHVLDTCLCTHTTKRVSLEFHVDDLLLAGTHQIIKEILTGLSRDLKAQDQRGDDKTNALLGTNPGKNRGGYNFAVDASYVESMLEEFNMSAL